MDKIIAEVGKTLVKYVDLKKKTVGVIIVKDF